jgi:Na+-driven multidrug efflux pump
MGNELFEKAPIHTAYLKLAIPVVLSMVVTLIYNMVDTYFIALTNNTALIAGVSICAPLFTLFLAFGDIFALGGSSVISRLLGAHKNE